MEYRADAEEAGPDRGRTELVGISQQELSGDCSGGCLKIRMYLYRREVDQVEVGIACIGMSQFPLSMPSSGPHGVVAGMKNGGDSGDSARRHRRAL